MINPSQIPLPDNTQHSQQTNIHDPGGIRTHNLSSRAVADLRLRPCGHWDSTASTPEIKEISYVATAHLKFYTFLLSVFQLDMNFIILSTKILESFLSSTILNTFLLILYYCKSSLYEVVHSYHSFRVT